MSLALSSGLPALLRDGPLLHSPSFCCAVASTTRAQAAELLYWDNYRRNPTRSRSPTSTAAVAVPSTHRRSRSTTQKAWHSTRRPDRLYVASSDQVAREGNGEIVFVNLDGSGAGVLSAPGATVNEPEGDRHRPGDPDHLLGQQPGDPGGKGSIGYAKLDGSGGGLLNTAGATFEDPYRLAVDPVSGRVYWGNTDDGSIPSPSPTSTTPVVAHSQPDRGATPSKASTRSAVAYGPGLLVETDEKRDLLRQPQRRRRWRTQTCSETIDGAYGLAIDPGPGRALLGQLRPRTNRTGAIGFADLAAAASAISPATAPVNGPQDPVILKSPTGTAAPSIARSATSRSLLTCSPGSWAADFAGSFVYQAPRTFAYQWTNNGAPVAGATATTLEATVGRHLRLRRDRDQPGRRRQPDERCRRPSRRPK